MGADFGGTQPRFGSQRHGKGGIVGKNDWPKHEAIEYEIYTNEDVRKMLEACETLRERALLLFAADTGFRYGGVAHAEVGDIDFTEGTIQTRSKARWGFTTKDHEQRINPVGDSLLEVLKQYCPTLDGTLLFPARAGKPDKHWNRTLGERL